MDVSQEQPGLGINNQLVVAVLPVYVLFSDKKGYNVDPRLFPLK